jgi:hypothetical protein
MAKNHMCVDFQYKLSGVTNTRQELTVWQIKSHFSIVCRFSLFSLCLKVDLHFAANFGVLRRFAAFCGVLRRFAVFCGELRQIAAFCGVLRRIAAFCGELRHFAAFCGILRRFAVFFNEL